MMDYTTFQQKLQDYSTTQLRNHESTSDVLEVNQEILQSFVDGATWFYENFEYYLSDKSIIHTVIKEYYSKQSTTHDAQLTQEMFSSGITWAIELLSDIKGLYRFFAYLGYKGTLEGAFIATTQEINNLIGQYASFEESLNTEETIGFIIKPEHLILVTDDEYVVNTLENRNFCVGVNPLDHII